MKLLGVEAVNEETAFIPKTGTDQAATETPTIIVSSADQQPNGNEIEKAAPTDEEEKGRLAMVNLPCAE